MASATVKTVFPTNADRPVYLRVGWCWCVVIGLLFLAIYGSFISRMIHVATQMKPGKSITGMLSHIIKEPWNPDWSHLMVVPLISVFFVFRNRHRLVGLPGHIYPGGLVIFFLGLIGFAWGVYPVQNDMFQGVCMVAALFGMVLFLMGPAKMRVLWFPIAYLLFFIKISDRIWDRIAWYLQNITAEAATGVLAVLSTFLGFDVSKSGNIIKIFIGESGDPIPLAVAEACSGLRMLMAFMAVGVAMAYLTDRAWWQRLIMVLMAIPIAVAVNVARVTTLGLLSLVNEEMTKGDFHTMIGMFMLVPAAGLFWLLGWILDKIVIYDKAAGPPAGSLPARHASLSSSGRSDRRLGDEFSAALRGLAMGVSLAALVSLNYYLLFLVFQPQRNNLNLPFAIVLFVTSIVMLAVAAVLIRRALALHINRSNLLPWRSATIALATIVGILFATLGTLNAAVKYNNIVLNKLPLKLRWQLYRLPKRIGPWQVVRESGPLDTATLEVLGTTQYITWEYQDKSAEGKLSSNNVTLHIAYYTGLVDTVAHVPERCILASGGAKRHSIQTRQVKLEGSQYRPEGSGFLAPSLKQPLGVYIPSLDVPITLFRYYPSDEKERISTAAYFFVANGSFFDSPDKVRAQGMAPWDRYRYYCKVELGLDKVSDPEEIVKRVSQFLSHAMPEIMACLPDWRQVTDKPQQKNIPQKTY